MKVSISETSTWQKTLDLQIPRDRVETEEKRVLKEYRSKVVVDGFRKGKAPEQVILKRHGDAIRTDAIENILPDVLSDALTEHEISPLTTPRIIDLSYAESGPLTVKAVVEVMPEFKVKGYRGLKLEKPVRPIDDQDVDEALEGLRERTAELLPVERAARDGDYLLADILECDEAGTPIIGRKSENRTLLVAQEGEGSQVGRQLMGVSKGDERRVVVEHGEEAEDAAAQSGAHRHVFLVQVHEVKEKKLTALDDEYARGLGDFEDLAHLRRVVREDLEKQVDAESRRAMVGQAIDQLIKANDVEVPESLVQRYLDGVVEDYKQAATDSGQQVDEGMVRQEYRGVANVQLKWQLLQARIASQEEIQIGDEEVQVEVAKFADHYNLKPDEAWKALQAQGRLDRIRSDLQEQKVVDLLLDGAKIKERKVARKEMEAPESGIVSGHTPSARGEEPGSGGSGLIITP